MIDHNYYAPIHTEGYPGFPTEVCFTVELIDSKTKETMYFERFSTISVARTSGDNPNWDNVPVLIKGNSKVF